MASQKSKFKSGYKAMQSLSPDYQSVSFKGTYKPQTYTDSYEPGTYQSEYLGQINDKLNQINNWSYDPLQDANYKALAGVYTNRGNLAAKTTLADAAALNGGYGTSNAVVASQQTRDQYNQELASLIPQLEQNAYNRATTSLGALMDLDNALYGRFSDDQSRILQGKQYGLDVFNTNEANRYNAANYLLDRYMANQGERQFAYNAKSNNVQNAISNAYTYLNYLDQENKGGSSGGGRGRGGSYGGSYSSSGNSGINLRDLWGDESGSTNPLSDDNSKKYTINTKTRDNKKQKTRETIHTSGSKGRVVK